MKGFHQILIKQIITLWQQLYLKDFHTHLAHVSQMTNEVWFTITQAVKSSLNPNL